MKENRNTYKVFVGKHKGKRPLGRTICRWEDAIKLNLRDMG
jgi:hypothetical protein